MILEPHTLLAVASLASVVTAGALGLLWVSDRREHATLWMAAATLLCATSAVLREGLPETAAIVLANVVLACGLGSIATACRVLGRRGVSWPALSVAPLAWLCACAVPAFLDNQQLRTVASSLSCSCIMAWAVAELWRERRERLWSRIGLGVILAIQGVAALVRAIVTALSHVPPEPGVARTADVARTTFWAFGSLLLIAFGLVFFLRERMQMQMRRFENEDRLTGLPNGRRFDEAFAAAFHEALALAQPVSILMVEPDAAETETGVSKGTVAGSGLQTIAEVIAASVAPVDGFVAHKGGGRFAVMLPGLQPAEVLRIADAVRRSIRDAAIAPHGSPSGRLTISIGYACAVPADGMRAPDLQAAAAQALHVTQQTGRDRVLRSAFPHRDTPWPGSEAAGGATRPA